MKKLVCNHREEAAIDSLARVLPNCPAAHGFGVAARNVAICSMLTAIILAAGCGHREQNASTEADQKSKAARSEVERGPVRLSVSVEPAKARLSDEPKLTIEIEYPKGVTIRKPDVGSALGDFILRDFREPLLANA